ncbi:MAG: TadE/TadG family type IV pilus assembly protein [Acidobacteriaceae bacterium]
MKRIVIANSQCSAEGPISNTARRASHHREIGQALVELALTMPLLVLLLLGAAELGRLAYAAIETSNAARAGVQYGAQNHVTASDFAGMQIAATNDAQNVSGLTATAIHFCGCSDGTPSTCSTGDCEGSRMLEYVQVNTSTTFDPLVYCPALPKTFTVNGQAIMRVWQ